jgi:two-component system response regulator HydG
VRGSFTDAVTDREGAFQYADGGTLFLDEVGDMPMSTQIKLLRVLEEHQITRVGDNKPIKVNVRLVSATNRPLEQMITDGQFRNDLYFRLKVVTVHLPPLRDRRDDIVPLMDHFRKQFIRRHNRGPCNFTPAVTRKFYAYSWPGNIRQLRNFVETMVVLDTDGKIGKTMDDIERWAIEETLRMTAGNREEAAKILDIGARTLYRKLDKYRQEPS